MKLTDISNNKAKEIIEGAPKEATHFSCVEGKTQYYKNETVISSLDEVFINVFRDIFQPSVFLLSDLENQMNIDKVETQTPEELHPDPQQGEVWRCILLPRQYVIYLYKAHNEWDTDWVNSELLEGQTIKPIQKLYTQSEVEAMPNAVATEHQEAMSTFSGAVWNNGDTCIADEYFGDELLTFVGMAHGLSYENDCVVIKNGNAVPMRVELLSKPETPQQREERERLEAAYDLYLAFWSASKSSIILESFKEFSWGGNSDLKHFLAIVDKTNYRKESN